MVIKKDISLQEFEAWQGAIYTKNFLIEHQDDKDFERYIEEIFPTGCEDIELNDILWFGTDEIAQYFGFETWEEYEKDREES